MKKDIIYIDIEDDITSIIEKVKAASAPIVALVPPKRAGVLQSAVNLKLLQKAAGTGDKRVVLITSDHTLTTLAAGVKIPVAKNLQSKPEIAPIDALEIDDEDVINGDDLPVGDLAKTAPGAKAEESEADKALSALQKNEDTTPPVPAAAKAAKEPRNRKTPNGMKVPDFGRFRKWLFIGVGGGILLIIFLIWAIFWAPRATVTITASTTKTPIDMALSLNPNSESKLDQRTLRPIVQELKKTQSVDFTATGEKEVGEKAKGRVTLSNCETPQAQTIAAGTVIEADGNQYTLNASVRVPGGKGDFISGCTEPGESGQVSVTAADIGSDYNVSSGTNFSVKGHGDELSATASTRIDGGSKKTVKVVSGEDVAKAKEKLKDQDKDSARDELEKKFTDKTVIIKESFAAAAGDPVSEPAIDQEASSAKLTVETTYTLYGLKRSDVKKLLDDRLKEEIDGRDDQRIYDNGENDLSFSDVSNSSVRLTTAGYTGPKIEEKQLAKELEGKRYGEIQQKVEAVRGVEDVHTDFWPFWVTSAPSADKITIKFVVSTKDNDN